MFPHYEDYDPDDNVGTLEVSEQDEELLKEIRDRYAYAVDAWDDIRKERNKDMRYVCGDPWEPEERAARENKDARRPCISHDELGQYINQSIANIRQNKRGIKVLPAGTGADEKSAEYRQNRIRAIEYRCKAQISYETAYQHCLEGSYGFWRISREYVSNDKSNWNQEIVIKPIPNPDAVLYDPNCQEPDWSDARWCFVVENMPKDEFKRRYPKARVTDFTGYDDSRISEHWVNDYSVLVAEYWKVELDSKTQTRRGKDGKPEKRTVFCKHVVQYVTNGVEILEKKDQPGEEIPIPCVIGLERYLNNGTSADRKIFSLVRLARDPQMSLAYLCSLEAEAAGMVPKTPWVAYVGQLETDKKHWETATKVPYPYLLVDPIPDSANGQILPLPQRQMFSVDFGSFEVAKESARRAIQAAMGVAPLPTAAQRNNEKSGIAIQRIQEEQALGSYHFVDNFERALERSGRIIESWLPIYDDTERDVTLCLPDETRKIVTINKPQQIDPLTGQPMPGPIDPRTGEAEPAYTVEEGEHDVTISVGPSSQSQREAADDFLDAVVSNLQNLVASGVLPPPAAAKLLSMCIEMKQLGPKGDEMAAIISPDMEQEMPPQAQAIVQQASAQVQQMQAVLQQLQAENQKLTFEKQARIEDNQSRMEIERLKAEADLRLEQMKIEGNVLIAEINAKNQQAKERAELYRDEWSRLHEHAHERGMQAVDNAHEIRMHDEEQAAAAELAAQEPAEGEK